METLGRVGEQLLNVSHRATLIHMCRYRFYNLMHDENDDHHQRLQDAKLEDFRRYFDWRLTTGNSTTQSSIWTEWKFLLCVFLDETGQEVCASVRIEMHRVSIVRLYTTCKY